MLTYFMPFIKIYLWCLVPAIYFTYQQRKIYDIKENFKLNTFGHFISVWLITPIAIPIILYKVFFKK